MDKDLVKRVKEAAESLVGGLAMEAVDVTVTRQGGRLFLRVFIDKDGGVTIEDCATANNLLGEIIERDGLVKGAYVLEVMSPGVDRPLKKPSDFKRSIGKRVTCKLKNKPEDTGSITGIITAADDSHLAIDAGKEQIEFTYEDLSAARLDPELPW